MRSEGGTALPKVGHITTAHRADDVRIFERECRSLAGSGRYDVYLMAAGTVPGGSGVTFLPLPPIPQNRSRRFITGPWRALALTGALDFDLWHFHDPELLPVALRLARAGHHVVWDAHEDYVGQMTEAGGKSWVPAPLRGVVRAGTGGLLRAVDHHASGIVAATPHIASRYGNPRTTVVGNEARLELFADCRPAFDAKQVLFTGAANPGQSFPEVVEAVAMVPGARLAVAGRDPDPVAWSWATQLLGGRIRHLGWLDRQAVAAAMASSTIGLCTYADLPTNADNSPNKLFEFGAAGLPVVATPTPSNAQYLKDSGAGTVATGFGPRELAAAISTAMADRTAWDQAAASGRRWAAREGSWAGSEARLLALYDDVLRERRRVPAARPSRA